jgi:uncharacterized protein HemX
MRRSKKFIVIALLAVVVLAGSIGGVVYAQSGNDDNTQTKAQALLDKVAEIYQQNTGVAIDSEQLKTAFTQAEKELRDTALDNYLQSLVDQNKITSDQAQQYKTWLNSKPDVPLAPGFPGGQMRRGFGRFGGWCLPPPQTS